MNIKSITPAMINQRDQISLKPKGCACFIDVSSTQEDQSDYTRVQIKESDLGRKLGYTAMLDVISYFQLAQFSIEAQMATAEVEPKQLQATPEAAPDALDAIAKPKRPRRKAKTKIPAVEAQV